MRSRTGSAATRRWDYVVVGAGAAGCVVAGRLSQTMPDVRIALIEAGGARLAHAHGRRGARWVDDAAAIEAMKRKVPAAMTECFELIERKLLKGPWVMGEQYTICDPYLFTIGTWIEGDGVDTTKLPRVMEHRKRMLARPAVQKAAAVEGTQIA